MSVPFKEDSSASSSPSNHSSLLAIFVLGLDILGPFPRAVGGFEYLSVAIDKFTKWPEVEAVRKVTAQSAVKFFKGLVCRFGVPNRVITDNGTQFTSRTFM